MDEMASKTVASTVVARLENLGKVFVTEKVETHALAAVSLTIARGEYVLVRGPSGCGKTTLLSILGLLETPSSGRYTLLGVDAERLASLPGPGSGTGNSASCFRRSI